MQKYANIRLVVNSEAYFIDKCMAVMAMIMRGNNESMLRKQFDWLNFKMSKPIGSWCRRTTSVSELANERPGFEMLFSSTLRYFKSF